ncbi:MAG: LacI family DNA-binding transcriptional regulator [Cyclobacteriaceae bacterium]|nr:LacI family DNA-binding transcriptional regulator [Cyclobacteriaceae bacterium HetDA_MAG_MS6]
MAKENYTIRDIAELANVSRGTVDRVIHNRGKVSETAVKKVKEVLEKINYEPNLIARSLKAHKNNVVAIIIPDYSEDNYWRQCVYGIRRAEKEFRQFGISLQYYEYQKTREAYEQKFSDVIVDEPDAVLIVPIYYSGSLSLFRQLEEREIPYSLINTPIEDLNYQTFIGQDYRKSGRVAAQLMETLVDKEKKVVVVHVEQDFENSTHLHEKEEGFKEYFRQKNSTQQIEALTFKNAKDLSSLHQELPNIAGIFMTTSQTYEIADYLPQDSDIKVIGYDLIPKNVEYLRLGKINILIHQNPKQQGYDGVSYLSEHLLYKKEMPKVKLLPLDVVVSENVDCYL